MTHPVAMQAGMEAEEAASEPLIARRALSETAARDDKEEREGREISWRVNETKKQRENQ